jgi:hypothetical protein
MVQVRGCAHASGQAIFGVDCRSEISSDGADGHDSQRRQRTDQQLPHPHILDHGCSIDRLGTADQHMTRYR